MSHEAPRLISAAKPPPITAGVEANRIAPRGVPGHVAEVCLLPQSWRDACLLYLTSGCPTGFSIFWDPSLCRIATHKGARLSLRNSSNCTPTPSRYQERALRCSGVCDLVHATR